jgi:hypothetical protein
MEDDKASNAEVAGAGNNDGSLKLPLSGSAAVRARLRYVSSG